MKDTFAQHSVGLESPAQNLIPITPSDSEPLSVACRALNVAQGGQVRVTTVTGDTATLTVAAGIPFPVRIAQIWATGTTATGLVGLY